MYTQLQLLRSMETAKKNHVQKIRQMERTLPLLPDGFLTKCNNSYYKVTSHDGQKDQLIISPGYHGREQLISDLQEKRYIQKSLPALKKNLKLIESFLNKYQLYDLEKICNDLPEVYQDFDFRHLQFEDDICRSSWTAFPQSENPAFPENLKHQSDGGLLTRSKAEAMIATKLEHEGILFKYEPSLWLGEHHIYPDFAALHQIERRIIYWEHGGLMDVPEYAVNMMEKLRVYSEHGIHLGDNLILTWETSNNPLTYAHIKDRIYRYICSKK